MSGATLTTDEIRPGQIEVAITRLARCRPIAMHRCSRREQDDRRRRCRSSGVQRDAPGNRPIAVECHVDRVCPCRGGRALKREPTHHASSAGRPSGPRGIRASASRCTRPSTIRVCERRRRPLAALVLRRRRKGGSTNGIGRHVETLDQNNVNQITHRTSRPALRRERVNSTGRMERG